ncbi:hypothetical protein Tco_0241960 [Tanacetum coccineum]
METQKPLLKDEDDKEVDVYMYRSMIGSLMYLTSSRPDIMFIVCACARYQVNPNVSHLHAMKRIFSDYAGASLDRKSTIGGKAKKIVKLMMEKLFRIELELMLFWSTVKAKTINEEVQLHALVDGKKIIITESTVRRDLQLADEEGVDCLPNSTIFEQLTLMGSQGTNSGGGPRCQETMRDTTARTRFKSVSKHSNDSLLARGNTLQSDEDRLKLDELMALCTTLQNKVLDLEKTKTTQHNEIASLKRRVKKLEKKNRSRTHRLKRLYKVGLTARVESSDNEESLGEDASKQGRIDAIDADEEITMVSVQNVDEEIVHDVNVSAGEEVFAITVDDITLAQVLEEMKSIKPKRKGVFIQELGESTTTISLQLSSQQSHNKGKGILIEHAKPMNKKDLTRLDEETTLNLQAEFDKEERLASEKAEKEEETNIALIETWDDIQAKIDADHQLAKRMQA